MLPSVPLQNAPQADPLSWSKSTQGGCQCECIGQACLSGRGHAKGDPSTHITYVGTPTSVMSNSIHNKPAMVPGANLLRVWSQRHNLGLQTVHGCKTVSVVMSELEADAGSWLAWRNFGLV